MTFDRRLNISTVTMGTLTRTGRLYLRGSIGRTGMPDEDQVIAVGLLTSRDLEALGAGFSRFYPVDETPCFGELLRAIDEADRTLRNRRSAPREKPGAT
jgi:hypothetical protein